MEEVERLASLQGAEINEAKKILANEATALCRGPEAAALAAETARKTFEEGASDNNLPTISLGAEGLNIVQGTTALGFATSNKEVRRKLSEGAIRVNGEVVSDPTLTLKPGDKVSFGAKKHGLVTA
jgi:tyrosyl-tRNA synthetase